MNRIEIEADLKFAAHRGCGTIITTRNHRKGEGRLLGGCANGRYRLILESVDGDDPIPPRKVVPMLFHVLLSDGGEMYVQAEAAHYVAGHGVRFLIDDRSVGFVPAERFVGFTSREHVLSTQGVA